MRISCMPAGIVDPLRTGQGIIDIKRAGFEAIAGDISIYAPELSVPEYRNMEEKRIYLSKEPDRTAEALAPFMNKCKENSLPVSYIYAPYLSRDKNDDALNGVIRELAVEAVKLAIENNIAGVIVRPLNAGIEHDALYETNIEFYKELDATAGTSPVRILTENQGRAVGGHLIRGFCSDAVEACRFVDELNEGSDTSRFGICFNVATSALCGQNPYEVITVLGRRIEAVVLSDNDGVHDTTFLPFSTFCRMDQTDWLGVIRGLRQVGFDGELMLAMSENAKGVSPLVRPKLLEYALSVAEYIRWQLKIEDTVKKYPARVLFGAGNMCLNYMKNYGDKYPPLYTCDNNPSRWGETFAGLEIKNPKELNSLSEDTAIFICNVYYREIEEQLRQMGLANPVERFNDEYLPVLNMNRIDRKQEGT